MYNSLLASSNGLVMIEQLHPFVISFLIGLLIGIERERNHPAGTQAMGVRTFALLALLGTLTSKMDDPLLSTVISLFVFGIILLSYFRTTEQRQTTAQAGITTEISAAAVYCIGIITPKNPLAAAILGATILLTLLGRKRLHRFSRNQLKASEIRAAMIMLVIGLGMLPFLPNYPLDPWQLFNPRRFGTIVFVIATLQFGGYVAMRVFGHQLGMLLTGFFGGLISSTAVFATLPKRFEQRPDSLRSIMAAAMAACVAQLITLFLVLNLVSSTLLQALLPPLSIMIVFATLSAFFLSYKTPKETLTTKHSNPLDLKSVLQLSVFIGSALIGISILNHFLGPLATQFAVFLGGFFELHSVSFATATLFAEGKINLYETEKILSLAVLASFLTKFFLLWFLARNRFAAFTSLLLLLMMILGGSVFYSIFQEKMLFS